MISRGRKLPGWEFNDGLGVDCNSVTNYKRINTTLGVWQLKDWCVLLETICARKGPISKRASAENWWVWFPDKVLESCWCPVFRARFLAISSQWRKKIGNYLVIKLLSLILLMSIVHHGNTISIPVIDYDLWSVPEVFASSWGKRQPRVHRLNCPLSAGYKWMQSKWFTVIPPYTGFYTYIMWL